MPKPRSKSENAPPGEAVAASESQLAIQSQFIELFVSAAGVLGVPRSIGEIYGVIFAAPQPLTFQEIVERLNLSKGSVSQGLRTLRSLGAVRTAYVPGDRRDFFEPETELRNLVAGLLRDRIQPHMEQGGRRLSRLRDELAAGNDLSEEAARVLRSRVGKLENWRKKSALLLPLVAKVLG